MYEWFSKRKNRIIYAIALVCGYLLSILLTIIDNYRVNELRLSVPQNVDYGTSTLWTPYIFLLIFLGLVFLLLAIFRMAVKKPSKVYWYIGLTTIAVQVFLLGAVLPIFRVLFG